MWETGTPSAGSTRPPTPGAVKDGARREVARYAGTMSTKRSNSEILARLFETRDATQHVIDTVNGGGSAKEIRAAHAAERRALRGMLAAAGMKLPPRPRLIPRVR